MLTVISTCLQADKIKFVNDLTVSFRRRRQNGATALHFAAKAGHVDALRLLLDKGADVTAAAEASARPNYEALRRLPECARTLVCSAR